MRYVALLRGINLGGNKIIAMAELRNVFEQLGFQKVASYINSGNLAFDSKVRKEADLVRRIERAIEDGFGMQVAVMVRSRTAIRDILLQNPFVGLFESHKQMHVLFMKEPLRSDANEILLTMNSDDERFAVGSREIYYFFRSGFAGGLVAKGLVERKLKIPVTARNWRTVEKLAELTSAVCD